MGTECPYLLLENCPGRLWKGDKALHQGWAFSQVPGDIFPKQPHAGSAPFTALRLRVCTGWQFKAMRKGSGSTHLLRAGTFLPAHFPPTGWSQNTHPSTTPSRKTGALLVHATTGPVSNRLRSPAKEHITKQRLNACGSHRTPARFCCQELSAIHAETLLHQWHLRQSLSTPRREHTLLVYFRGFAS